MQFFLVESIAIGKPIRGGRGVDPYTVLLRDAIPAVFYLSQDTSILRGTITLREKRGSLGWRRSLDGVGGWILPYISLTRWGFGPFWNENGYTLPLFCPGVPYGF